jgi:DNA-binding CsgD family transcriptional regulator
MDQVTKDGRKVAAQIGTAQSKLGVRNRPHAIAEAMRQHLIP